MKNILITIIAALLVVGCGGSPKDILEAGESGNIEAIKKHLTDGADVNSKNNVGQTPLHEVAGRGHNKEVAALLITAGADVNAKDNYGMTPLHYTAAFSGHKEIAELLIAKGANMNTKNAENKTPLDSAIQRKLTEIADLLRKHGGKRGAELKAEGK